MARPTKYDKRFVQQVYELSLLGLTEEEKAKVFGVTLTTLKTWRKLYPEYEDANKRGGVVADAKVATGLYQRAIGYEHPETLVHVYLGKAIKTRVTKRYAPDVQAAAQWLHNRQAARWRKEPDPTDGQDETPTPVKVVVEVKSGRIRPDDDAPAQ